MAVNHFETLGLTARPWLEPEVLQAEFLKAAAKHHPDRGGDAAAIEAVNLAKQLLADPAKRIRHVLELSGEESAGSAPGALPKEAAGIFSQVQKTIAVADDLLKRLALAKSPLGKATLASDSLAAVEACETQSAQVVRTLRELERELREIDSGWPGNAPEAKPRLLELAGGFAFLGKWLEQLRERAFRLTQQSGIL